MQAPSHRASVAVSPWVFLLMMAMFRTPIPLVREGHVIALLDEGRTHSTPAIDDLRSRLPCLHVDRFVR